MGNFTIGGPESHEAHLCRPPAHRPRPLCRMRGSNQHLLDRFWLMLELLDKKPQVRCRLTVLVRMQARRVAAT